VRKIRQGERGETYSTHGSMRNSCKISVENPEVTRPLKILRFYRRAVLRIILNWILKEIRGEVVDCIDLAQNRDQ
jgi:hypothetical protein